jgi:RNA polymerase sigma-70 factor (ECF subfamily)
MTRIQVMPMANIKSQESEPSLRTRWSLIGRLKDWGDQESWQEFFNAYWKLIYAVALKAGLSEAEAQDVVQERVISVAKKMPEFKCDATAGSFQSWLLTLTRWRIVDQMRKRGRLGQISSVSTADDADDPSRLGPKAGLPLCADDTARTSTVERVPDPAGPELEAIWNEEWEKNLLEAATERVKRQVDAEQYQLFHFHVLKQWPAKKVASKLGVSLGQVYFAKYKISALLKKESKRLAASALLPTN